MELITLKDDINSQENMEQWLSQLGHPDNPISNNGVLVHLEPHFVSCDFANREATIGFEALEWELNPGGSLHGGSGYIRTHALPQGSLHAHGAHALHNHKGQCDQTINQKCISVLFQ